MTAPNNVAVTDDSAESRRGVCLPDPFSTIIT